MGPAGLFPGEPVESPIIGEQYNLYAQIVFDRPLEVPYTYAVPSSLEGTIKKGARVLAPLGRGDKNTPGWCVDLTGTKPERTVKPLRGVLDPEPLVDDHLLELTRWMADYYLCGWGQALQAVVPAGVRKDSKERQTTWLRLPAIPITHQLANAMPNAITADPPSVIARQVPLPSR